jgi:hypothetical protein
MADETVYPYEGELIRECRACGARIFFKVLSSGKYMPVSEDTGKSHFLDCPKASSFSRRSGPRQGRNVKYKRR